MGGGTTLIKFDILLCHSTELNKRIRIIFEICFIIDDCKDAKIRDISTVLSSELSIAHEKLRKLSVCNQ